MYNQEEIIEAICREEREAQARWDSQFEGKGFHTYFSTDLDGEVMRCDNCGMNILGRVATCEEYLKLQTERNKKLSERIV